MQESSRTVGSQFSTVVAQNPDAIAIFDNTHSVSYRELDRQSNGIASEISSNVRVQAPVLLLFQDPTKAIAAMVACMKLGRPYVPLSPTAPIERLQTVLSDAASNALISESACASVANQLANDSLFMLDIAQCEGADVQPASTATPDTAAWILYTSGSTGVPKGVVQTQRNLLHYVDVYKEGQALTAHYRISLLSSYTANIASHDIFSALLNGATICPYSVSRQGIANLGEWIEMTQITVFSCVPTLFRQLVRTLDHPRDFTSLRFVKLIGEPVYRRDFDAYIEHFPETCRFINRLGSSETGTIRWLFAEKTYQFEGLNLPVGYAVRDNDIEILDEDDQPTEPGEVGEIVVQSGFLSPGYWNRSELTAQAFDGQGAARRFHTGDMGRQLPDGCLVHVGRKDAQIKIRGYRVEVAGVETVVLEHPAIEDVLVMLREDVKDQQQLVAYFVSPDSPTTTELREWVASKLPEHMIPNVFVQLDGFPLAANGKIKRSALPAVGKERPAVAAKFIAPRSELEEALVAQWKQVLHLDEVGVRDSFLDLGGHSLHAMHMLNSLREQFGIEISAGTFFDSPTIEQLAELLHCNSRSASESMSLEERSLLETELLAELRRTDFSKGIPRRTRESISVPLSCAQERMWFMDQLSPGLPVYNMPWAARIRGPLQTDRLASALNELVARHEILRTTYGSKAGRPEQQIHEDATIELEHSSLDSVLPGEMDAVQHIIHAESDRAFDLSRDLPLRATLIRLAEEDHVLVLVVHHIALDGWGRSTLTRELGMLYRSAGLGESPALPELSIQYADYATWQRNLEKTGAFDSDLAYWQNKLRGLPSSLKLPIAATHREYVPHAGGEIPFHLPSDTAARLRRIAHAHAATPFMVLAAAVFALLRRYTGEADFAVGTPVAGRERVELESQLGLFVNTLVLRGAVSGDQPFTDLLKHTRSICLEAYEHQRVPFDRIVASLGSERVLDRSPIVQIMLAYRTHPEAVLDLGDLECDELPIPENSSKFDLSLDLWDTDQGISGRIIYAKHLFEPSQIERLAHHFVQLIDSGTQHPELRIDELTMLCSQERKQIVQDWNATRAPSPDVSSLHRLFEEVVVDHPVKTAVVYKGTQLTYAELNHRANQVAAYLKTLGAQSNTLVGVSMHRSTDLIVALLGVLKSGAAYLPLDPAYPSSRIQYMMEDASVLAVITDPELVDQLPDVGVPTLALEPQWYAHGPDPLERSALVDPSDLAYVMYTSGSTGKPKGVMVEHRNVVGFVNAYRDVVPATPERVSTNVITYAFDTSVEEIFSPLCSGGTLHIVPYETTLDGRALGEFLLEHEIRTAYVVPDLLPAVAEAFRAHGGCGQMRCLITGLEPKKQRVLQDLRDVAPNLSILNAYGPTEVTYGATAYDFITSTDPEADVPIGKPFPNYQVYIVNDALQPTPVGVTGELLIGGVGVARGYLNRPELTEERFIANPFGSEGSDRLYRTGDLARYLPDGNIEFLGRGDSQVKIRGHRIELREIELALESHPSVTRGHVRVIRLADDDVRLAAYLIPTSDHMLDEDALIAYLRSQLPAYMIPASHVILSEFPLLPTGKVDPEALPSPKWHAGGSESSAAPETPTELAIAQVWADVLGVDAISLHDDFFSLGGHSLLATRVLARLQESLQVKIPIRVLFEDPTVAGLAAYVRGLANSAEVG